MEVINVMSLADWEQNPLKVYPYLMNNVSNQHEFLQDNTTIILSISNVYNEGFKIDENGFYYIEVIPQASESTGATKFNFASFSQLFEINDKIECAAANLPSNNSQKNIDLGSYKVIPYIFTVGRPYSYQDYIDEKQQVFIIDNQITILETDDDESRLVNEGYQEATFINIKELTKEFKNFNLLPFDNFSLLERPNLNGKTSFIIKYPFSSLLAYSLGLIVKVITEDNILQEYDYEITNTGFVPFYLVPIDVTDRNLTVYAGWWDYDIAMPYVIARNFLKNDKLQDQIAKFNGKFVDADVPPLFAMFLINYAYSTEFAEFPRIVDRNQADYGKIDATKYVGSVFSTNLGAYLYNIGILASRSPSDVMSNIYQKWYRINAMQETDVRTQHMKQLIAMLSKYIGSKYAIGGDRDNGQIAGANAFNEIYLPWYLRITNPTRIVKLPARTPIIGDSGDIDSFQLAFGDQAPRTILQSRHFTQNSAESEFTTTKNWSLGKIRLIQSDRKLTLPTVPDSIEAIDKLPLAGDIDTTSSDDLKYFFAIPLDSDDKLNRLMLYDFDTEPPQTVSFNTNWTNFGKKLPTDDDLKNLIKEQAAILYGVKTSDVEINSLGIIEENLNQLSLKKQDVFISKGRLKDFKNECINQPIYLKDTQTNDDYTFRTCQRSCPDWYCKKDETWNNLYSNEGIVNKYGWSEGTYKFDYNNSRATSRETSVDICAYCNFIYYDYSVVVYRYRMVNISLTISNYIKTVQRQTTHNKQSLSTLFSTLRLYDSSEIELQLQQVNNNVQVKSIYSISIGSIWRDYLIIEINGVSLKIPAAQRWDETIGRQNIIFI